MAHKLLLVDDERSVINSLVRALFSEDYTILTAANGPDALNILKKNRVDIVIVDHKMPDLTGLEVIKIVKMLYPDITRIMLTRNPDLIAFRPAVRSGEIQHYICKPWDDEGIKFKLQMITKGRKVIDPLCKR